jgi:TolA-binding protein
MIRRSQSTPGLAAVLAFLALVGGVRLGAAESHTPAPAAPAPPPAAALSSRPPAAPGSDHPAQPVEASRAAPPAPAPKAAPASKKAAPSTKKAAPADHASAHAAATGTIAPTEEIQSLLKLGVTLTERANYESAEIAFYQVLNHDYAAPADIKNALFGLARMQRKQGSLTKAAAIYERFLKDFPGDERTPDALLDLGRTLRALGIYKGAITRFYAVINSTLKLPGEGFEHYQVLTKTAQFEIAETHFQAGDFTEAAKFYTRLRLLDLAPSDRARAHFKAAYSLRLKGDLETSVSTLRAYIDLSPDDENVPEARYLLAVSLRELKRPEEAFAATLELLRTEQTRVARDPKRWAYWQRRTGNQLANDFFESGNTLNAQSIYQGLVDLSPEPTWRIPLTYQIGLCYERLGNTDRARASYQVIVDTLGATPPAELAELARMAAWRIDHLSWRDGMSQQVSRLFETTTGQAPPVPADPKSPAAKSPGAKSAAVPTAKPAEATPSLLPSSAPKPTPAAPTASAAAAAGQKTASTP